MGSTVLDPQDTSGNQTHKIPVLRVLEGRGPGVPY